MAKGFLKDAWDTLFPEGQDPQPGGVDYDAMGATQRRKNELDALNDELDNTSPQDTETVKRIFSK